MGPRGCALVDAGRCHVELVTRNKPVEIVVSDALLGNRTHRHPLLIILPKDPNEEKAPWNE
jgi:hypothetical protein